MNKKIVINATYIHENPTGLGVFTHELLMALLKIESDFDFTIYINSSILKNTYPGKIEWVTNLVSPRKGFKGHMARFFWYQFILPFKLKRQEAPILFSTVPEGILFTHVKQILLVNDIIPIKYPEWHPKMKYYYYYTLKLLLRNAQAIICVSENTKRDIIDYYKIAHKPIYVIHGGCNGEKFYPREPGRIQKHYGISRYLLYVGDIRPYKNLERAIEAFAISGLKDYKFVIGGKKDARFYPQLQKKIEDFSLRDKVVFLDYVPDVDLPYLYSEATVFVFPSLYEGFGLPALEAMASGCPVIASNVSSLPEICGDAAHYVDPYEVGSIAQGILKVIDDQPLREELIRKGLHRVKHFTWEKAAQKHIEVFKEVSLNLNSAS